MILRTVGVWFGFSAFLTAFSVIVQAVPFEFAHFGLAVLLAAPLALSTFLGGVGHGQQPLQYPGAGFVVLSTWILGMAPSLIVDNPEARAIFVYGDQGATFGRLLFVGWCVVFVLVSGSGRERAVHVQVRALDVIAITVPAVLAMAYLVTTGRFSNYQNSTSLAPVEAGGTIMLATVLLSIRPALPGLFLLVFSRAQGRLRTGALAGFLLSWVILFLAGSRSQIAFAVVVCAFLARRLGMKLTMFVPVAIGLGLPLVFVLVLAYRNALSSSEENISSLSGFVAVAADSTGSVVAHDEARSAAVTSFSENARTRFWSGPQFFAVVEEWLENGSTVRWTFLEGIVRSLPSAIFPAKNEIADRFGLEDHLKSTGRFPDVDLGSMPWQQCLFEFGLVGLLLGATFFGLLVRFIEARVGATRSLYELVFWIAMLAATSSPEQQIDGIFVAGRNIVATLVPAFLFASGLRRVAGDSRAAAPTA